MSDREECLLAAESWEAAATACVSLAEALGQGCEVAQINAVTYRRAATALRMQAENGVPVCVCHLKPYGNFGPQK